MQFLVNVLVLAIVHAVAAASVNIRSSYAVKETHSIPNKWTKLTTSPKDEIINLKIGFKNKQFHVLERHLYEVSSPDHPRYGQYLSIEQVNELTKPSTEATNAVDQWLDDFGIEASQRQYTPARDWVTISLPIARVEDLLDTKYSVYEHDDGSQLVRALSWSLPRHLHEHIATIQPTNTFFSPLRSSTNVVHNIPHDPSISTISTVSTGDVAADCNFRYVTPSCLRTLYKTASYVPKNATTVGFTNYLGQIPSKNDARRFLNEFRPDANEGENNYHEISIAGGAIGPLDDGREPSSTTKAGREANLDLQTILGLTYPLDVTSYSTGGKPPFKPDLHYPQNINEAYLEWLNHLASQTSVPSVISTSYGDEEQTVPESYANIVCQGFAALGARGITLLFSSGDNGMGTTGTCQSNDDKNVTKFLPVFPASCPYITAVGATQGYPEVAIPGPLPSDGRTEAGGPHGYSSGSGFSNYFSRPQYQDAAVDAYLPSINASLDGLYNKNGRAYPDIAAQGLMFAVKLTNKINSFMSGTSASSPCAAGVLALVNDALITSGRPPLGFLNPLLYSRLGAEAFNDVIDGASVGCGIDSYPAQFHAQKGWDAASGFGTPDFVKIMAALGVKIS